MQTSSLCALLCVAALACSSEPGGTPDAGQGGAAAFGGAAGAPTASGGATSANGGSFGGSTVAGAPSSGGSPSSGGTTSSGGATTSGGAPSSGGLATTGGVPGAGGSVMSGGTSAMNGSTTSSGGTQTGTGGSPPVDVAIAAALDGLRIDDACGGTPATTEGATCTHSMLTNNQFKATKQAGITGTSGASYDLTLRIRGVVEPTNIEGGTRAETSTFMYKNMSWRQTPYTVGGTVKAPDYQVWRISVDKPAQTYFLNDYQKTGHYVFKLDYQVTIPVAADAKVTLECADSNERQIDNYERYALDGIPGSMNLGQFVQVNVVSVKAR